MPGRSSPICQPHFAIQSSSFGRQHIYSREHTCGEAIGQAAPHVDPSAAMFRLFLRTAGCRSSWPERIDALIGARGRGRLDQVAGDGAEWIGDRLPLGSKSCFKPAATVSKSGWDFGGATLAIAVMRCASPFGAPIADADTDHTPAAPLVFSALFTASYFSWSASPWVSQTWQTAATDLVDSPQPQNDTYAQREYSERWRGATSKAHDHSQVA